MGWQPWLSATESAAFGVQWMQTSVWGSGSAGAFCAAMGLATGNFSLWQVGTL
jgi:hypothetical protein